jgi:predicted AAA+ superfamily ATPase
MKPLSTVVTPRKSVFDPQRRDTVLDLTNLAADSIGPSDFFVENYVTEGMQVLLEQAFRRLEGRSDQGVFLLRQAMGGGKTHNMITLGLLARHPEYRQKSMGSFYKGDNSLGEVKVIAFTGRETDAP